MLGAGLSIEQHMLSFLPSQGLQVVFNQFSRSTLHPLSSKLTFNFRVYLDTCFAINSRCPDSHHGHHTTWSSFVYFGALVHSPYPGKHLHPSLSPPPDHQSGTNPAPALPHLHSFSLPVAPLLTSPQLMLQPPLQHP